MTLPPLQRQRRPHWGMALMPLALLPFGTSLLLELLLAGGVLLSVLVADHLLLIGWRRLQTRLKRQQLQRQHPRPWLELVLEGVRLLLRAVLWLSTLGLLVQQLEIFRFLRAALPQLWQPLVQSIGYVLSLPLFTLGREAITLSKLFLFLVISGSIWFFSRWVSTWLKQRLLARLGLEHGTQEAVAGVVSYCIAALGVVIVLQTLGIDLSSLAVVAGVLGIGLGFGVQLLVSNFISGLAILVEQPIQVGNFIEVDGLLGTVEKISIRSTLIRTNDNQVVIVPNNRFLEKHIVNWSYRGTVNRLHIPISVAYGSDTVLITEALLSAARQESRVLLRPAPTVWFRRFGEWAYEMELLVWIDQPRESEPIRSALNFLIERELTLRGIEIPLPQQELRLRHPDEWQVLGRPVGSSNLDTTGNSPDTDGLNTNAGAVQGAVSQQTTVKVSRLSSRTAQRLKALPLHIRLRQVAYFEQCSSAELRLLIEQGYQKIFPPAAVIFQEGEPGETFYIILNGEVEVVSQQLEQPLATLKTGDFFGEISLLTGAPRAATVRTRTETSLFVVDRLALQKLLQTHRHLAEEIATQLAQRLQVSQELGLHSLPDSETRQETPLLWIRQRIQALFGI